MLLTLGHHMMRLWSQYRMPVLVLALLTVTPLEAAEAEAQGTFCWVCGCILATTHFWWLPWGCQWWYPGQDDCWIHPVYDCTSLYG